ncbi:extracellular solute-binding protein [Nesterenkonia xinjiangensis]|uniref:Multiple sugar transport system substrate-binding protein n=1 Tax=Nesterenkonia xinjiangensis TaxID=225327 RepID=A0A7Z0K9T4_9MICC|nr:extracellular solute-binding protein [Nesterenkonia xinjiangensis]NYJ79084.1 multiple sugar transport system substrate-binding protein [Nesterenkonia xinjiangensis]
MRRPILSRRQLLGGALAGAGAAALAGCAPNVGPADRTTLQFWHLLSGGDGITMAELLDGINDSQDDFFVRPTVLAWGTPYYTKLAMAGAGGRAPEVAIMHSTRVPGYVPGGLLDPWDEGQLAELGVDESTFTGPMWENSLVGGELYSVPLDAHPFLMMFNRDICQEAGVLESDGRLSVPQSPDEFISLCEEIGGVTGGNALSYGFLGDAPQIWRLFYTFYAQHGVTMEFPDGGEAVIDDDAFLSSLEHMSRLVDGTIASSRGNYDSAVAEFSSGSTGLFFSGVWELPTMQNAGIPVDMDMIPPIFGEPITYADSHSFVLPHQLSPDPQAREHTYEFVAQLLKDSVNWATAGHIAAYLPVVGSPEYQELLPQANYADAADHIVYDPTAWFTGSGSNFVNELGQMFQRAMTAGDGFEDALDQFRSYVNSILSNPNPVDPEGAEQV